MEILEESLRNIKSKGASHVMIQLLEPFHPKCKIISDVIYLMFGRPYNGVQSVSKYLLTFTFSK